MDETNKWLKRRNRAWGANRNGEASTSIPNMYKQRAPPIRGVLRTQGLGLVSTHRYYAQSRQSRQLNALHGTQPCHNTSHQRQAICEDYNDAGYADHPMGAAESLRTLTCDI